MYINLTTIEKPRYVRFKSQPTRSSVNSEHIKDERLEPDEAIQHFLKKSIKSDLRHNSCDYSIRG